MVRSYSRKRSIRNNMKGLGRHYDGNYIATLSIGDTWHRNENSYAVEKASINKYAD